MDVPVALHTSEVALDGTLTPFPQQQRPMEVDDDDGLIMMKVSEHSCMRGLEEGSCAQGTILYVRARPSATLLLLPDGRLCYLLLHLEC